MTYKIVGKIVGAILGYLCGGPYGLIMGLILGHLLDAEIDLPKLPFNLRRIFHKVYLNVLRKITKSAPRANEEITEAKVISPYQILNVDQNISRAELKKVYRKLMSQHHPDKLISKGPTPEMIQCATQKTQQIQAAYRQICKEHSHS